MFFSLCVKYNPCHVGKIKKKLIMRQWLRFLLLTTVQALKCCSSLFKSYTHKHKAIWAYVSAKLA